jgi:hypothetical protein
MFKCSADVLLKDPFSKAELQQLICPCVLCNVSHFKVLIRAVIPNRGAAAHKGAVRRC